MERTFNRVAWWVIAIGVSLSTQAASGRLHKLRIHDPTLARALIAKGGKLIADYGAFQLIESAEALPPDAATAESADEFDFIDLCARRLDTRSDEVRALRKQVGAFSGKHLRLVQFSGAVKREWRDALEATGAESIQYVPHNAYLVRGDAPALARLQAWARTSGFVQWEGSYADDYKIHPRARVTDAKGRSNRIGTDTFAVQMVADSDANPATLALIKRLELAPVKRQFRVLRYLNLIVRLPPGRLTEIAAQPEVVSIQPYFERQKFCERQDQIIAGNLAGNEPSGPGYLAWLASKGFTQEQFDASDFLVDLTDSGIDNGTAMPDHFGLYRTGNTSAWSRIGYVRLEGSPNVGSTLAGCDGHGTLNAHIIGGYDDLSGFPFADAGGYHYGLGVCPFVTVGSSVVFDPDHYTSPDLDNLESEAYQDGARISNNSWGSFGNGAYDVETQNYDALVRDAQPSGSTFAADGNQEMVIVFAAGNYGPSPVSIGPPGSGKNVITAGAAENVQAFGASDGSDVSDGGADSANDIIDFSSRGPCQDGRNKPDLCAPATHVSGGAPQSASQGPIGEGLECFDERSQDSNPPLAVSGGENGTNYFPVGQQLYTASSGTSESAPAVAGGCALLRQYFINNSLSVPSPAMTKAFLMNSARYLNGTGANDSLPSNNQGMGEMNLGTAFDGVPRALRDQLSADKFTATGQERTFAGTIADPGKPFRVTLAWTDAPGATFSDAYDNDLDLTVVMGGKTYKGNVFSGAYSTTGGNADGKNNVESVFLPAGLSGSFVVTVTAANINSDGVPNEPPSLDQDFALVIYNTTQTNSPFLAAESYAVTAESCLPQNGGVDPGETVTVSFALRNVGAANTTNLVATLQETGGVVSPTGPENYGSLLAGGASVAREFSFTASGKCGSTVAASLALSDNGTNLGTVIFNVPLGQVAPIFVQNFDSITAPTLPSGWITTASGGQSLWITSMSNADTLPNTAFTTDAGTVGVSALVSPTIIIESDATTLTFRHRYDTESGWDGGVLEIKVGAGQFMDILSAGGSFIAGGYNQTLHASQNPLAGRMAWSGNSGGFVTTTVNPPAAAAGQAVQFRWRCGTDESGDGAGWSVDSVSLSARVCCDSNFTQPTIVSDTGTLMAGSCGTNNTAIDPGETVFVDLGLKNIGDSNTTNLVATLQASGGVTLPSAAQNYGALDTNGTTVSRPFSFTADGACGGTITATLHLQDGLRDLGIAMFSFQLGQSTAVFKQDFDTVFEPALPADWTTSQAGSQSNWVTSTTSYDTVPNSVFSPDPSTAGVNELVSPLITLPLTPSQLIFQHLYDLESGLDGVAFDVGVLEIKIGSGPWTDILDAGGSFVDGGYSHMTSSLYQNPLAGRPGWSGTSGGFVLSVVNLPPSALGQDVRLRWRCGTDNSVGAVGWYVDSVHISATACCDDPPMILVQPQNQAVLAGCNAIFNVTASGSAPLEYQWYFEDSDLEGATAAGFTRVGALPSDIGTYFVVVSNFVGSVTSAPVTLQIVNRPMLLNPHVETNRMFTFDLSGDAGFNYQIEYLTNASTGKWTVAGVVSNANGQVSFNETNGPTDDSRLFRARLLP